MWHNNTLFKAGRVVWCGAVGYASGLKDVARQIISSINYCVASSWTFSLHGIYVLHCKIGIRSSVFFNFIFCTKYFIC
jgi:hypothetical protein